VTEETGPVFFQREETGEIVGMKVGMKEGGKMHARSVGI
jgi:hypothetical protein